MAIQRQTDPEAPQGLSLPELPQQQNSRPQPQQEARLLMETDDGFLVEVPESKVEEWQKAQEEYKRTGKLTRQQQLLHDKLMQRLRERRFD